MFNWLKKIGSVLLLFMITHMASAQIVGTYKKVEVGLGLGITSYAGDVAPTTNIKNIKAGGEVFFRYNFNPALSGRLSLGGYLLTGRDKFPDDPFQNIRNHRFSTQLADGSAILEYNFFNFRGAKSRPLFSPYVFAGIGILHAKIKYGNNGFPNTEGKLTESIRLRYATTIPFGVGLKFPIGKKFNLAWELRATKTFTDYLDMLDDDISNGSADPRFEFGNTPGNDMYLYAGLSIAYRFVTLKCPRYYPSRDYDFK